MVIIAEQQRSAAFRLKDGCNIAFDTVSLSGAQIDHRDDIGMTGKLWLIGAMTLSRTLSRVDAAECENPHQSP